MSNKKEKKNTVKKEAKSNTASMLKLDNDVKIPAMTIFMKDPKYFDINDIDINKIRVSEAKLFTKKINHTSITYFMKMVANILL